MAKGLMDSISELEEQIEDQTTNDGDTNGERRNDKSGVSARSKRQSADTEFDKAFDEGEEGAEDGGRGRSRRKPAGRKHVESGDEASQDDGEEPSSDGRRSQRHGKSLRDTTGRDRNERKTQRQQLNDEEPLDDQDQVDDEEGDDDQDQSPAAMARMRRENRELKAQLRRKDAAGDKPVDEKPASDQTQEKPKQNQDLEPEDKNSPEWKDWKIRDQDRRLSAIEGRSQETQEETKVRTAIDEAKGELRTISMNYAKKNADFAPAIVFAEKEFERSLRISNPGWTAQQITNKMQNDMLFFAAKCAKQGMSPTEVAESIYDMCIERFGYEPESGLRRGRANDDDRDDRNDRDDQGDEDVRDVRGKFRRPEGRRPNLRVVDNNRRRSASPLHGNGQGGSSRLTKQAVDGMTNGELLQLDPEDWKELESL